MQRPQLMKLREKFSLDWREDDSNIENFTSIEASEEQLNLWERWRNLYHKILQDLPPEEMEKVSETLRDRNPKTALLRPAIESVWESIEQDDNWQPFYELLKRIQSKN